MNVIKTLKYYAPINRSQVTHETAVITSFNIILESSIIRIHLYQSISCLVRSYDLRTGFGPKSPI